MTKIFKNDIIDKRLQRWDVLGMENIVPILAALVGIAFALLMIFRFAMFLSEFQGELRFINNEINRTSGKEKKRWERRRRRLWLSLLPFVKY